MKLTVTIKTDSAAFDDAPEHEAARILRELARKLEDGAAAPFPLHDYNGNRVGEVKRTRR